MDLVETGDDFVLRADLPGLTEQDVNIELEDNVLTISGERKAEHEERKEGYYRVERASGSFSRSLTLPEGVDPEAVTATFDHGVLEVRIPKPAAAQAAQGRDLGRSSNGDQPATIEGSETPRAPSRKRAAEPRRRHDSGRIELSAVRPSWPS